MKRRFVIFFLSLLFICLLPCVCSGEVLSYSVQNNVGTPPQEICVTIETTSDVLSVNLVNANTSFIPSSISQSNSGTSKFWTLTTLINNNCNDEWTIYLKSNDGSWINSHISFFVSIGNSGTPGDTVTETLPPPPPSWSTGSFAYAYADTKDYSDNRINSHSGPDNSYMDSGSYKTRKITGLSAFYREKHGGVVWIYAEMYYQNGYKRRVYFKNNQILYGDIPFVTFTRTPARLNETIIPTYGPAPDYDDFEDERYQTVTLRADCSVSILHEENGYFFIEFSYDGKDCRAWVPTYAVTIN